MTFNSYFEHTEAIFKELKILSIYKLNQYLTSLFMFRYHNLKNLPETFINYFIPNNEIHDHGTRNATKLHKTYKRTNYVIHTLPNKRVDVWNNIAPKYKSIFSYSTFKIKIKNHYIFNN
jgi:hypothetical protein